MKIRDENSRQGLPVASKIQGETLSDCVRSALRYYLDHLGGHEVDDLHRMVIGEVERPMIETVLEHTQGNLTRTAAMLGMSRNTLRKKMTQYGIGRGA